MKKFEALERVQQANAQLAASGGGGAAGGEGAGAGAAGTEQLTDEQLQEVFKQTSVFTVKSATAGPEFLYGHGAYRPSSGVAARSRGSAHPSCLRAWLTVPAPQMATTTTTGTAARTTGSRPRCRRGARGRGGAP